MFAAGRYLPGCRNSGTVDASAFKDSAITKLKVLANMAAPKRLATNPDASHRRPRNSSRAEAME